MIVVLEVILHNKVEVASQEVINMNELKEKAHKLLDSVPDEKIAQVIITLDTQKRPATAILKLPDGDTKQLKGFKELYRLRVGDYLCLP